MPLLKRPAATPAGRQAKRQQVESPFTSKCNAIISVLTEAEGYPEATLQMLASSVKSCFETPKSSRHMVQTTIIDMLAEVMACIEANHRKKIEEQRVKVAEGDTEKARRQTAAEAAVATMAQRAEAAKAAEAALAAVGEAKVAAAAEVTEVQAQQASGDAELAGAEGRKAAAEAAMAQAFGPLKDGSVQDVASAVDQVIRVGKDLGLEEQLLDTAIHVMSKPATERAAFDGVVMQQMDENLKEGIARLAAQLSSGEAGKAERAAKVQGAQAKVEDLTKQAEGCREELKEAKAASVAAVEAKEATAKAVQDLEPELAEATAQAEMAESVLVAFQADLKVYKELVESAPEEAAAALVDEPAEVAVPAKVVDEQA